jgi:SsrA-binding protein
MADKKKEIIINNKKARFEYAFEDTFTAGIQLSGTEVKSIRDGNASITEAYCAIEDSEAFLLNAYISEYKQGTYNNHIPKRKRKLLLQKKELKKVEGKLKDKGYALIPLQIFESETGFFKIEIGLGRGKKAFDKREDIKKRDIERDMKRI